MESDFLFEPYISKYCFSYLLNRKQNKIRVKRGNRKILKTRSLIIILITYLLGVIRVIWKLNYFADYLSSTLFKNHILSNQWRGTTNIVLEKLEGDCMIAVAENSPYS